MKYKTDGRVVMTLDAGGTNFVFSAIQGNEEVAAPITLPSHADDLQECLNTICEGFVKIKTSLKSEPVAISFAFPGPADYPNGIIGDLGNLPAFRGGVALGPMLHEQFNLPVFINNDGDLYAYGEALAGYLPYINNLLEESGSPKRFHNLFGITLGTGLGGGLVHKGTLYVGDNSAGSEIWLLRNKLNIGTNAEEGVSIRAAQRVYAEQTGISEKEVPSPKEIYEIGVGKRAGNQAAAKEAFRQMGEVLGDVLGNILSIVDGLVVIGGGVASAKELIVPAMMAEVRSSYTSYSGRQYPRISQKAFFLDDEDELGEFIKGNPQEVGIPGSDKKTKYDALSRVGIGFSKIGTSEAVALGAYAFALDQLDQQ